MIIVDIAQGSDLWKADFRLNGIGSSDSPVVLGNSPYKTVRDLYLEKKGYSQEDNSKDFIFALGHKTEGLIRAQFQELTGVEMKPLCAIHSKFNHIRSSFDGFSPKLGVLEAKLVGQEVLSKAREGAIPPHHYTQIQHQLAVADADVAQWFGHDGKKNGVLVEVRADKVYIDKMLDLEHEFWSKVLTNQIPPLTEKDYLVPEDQGLLEDLKRFKELVENATADFESAKEAAINNYGHTKISGNGIKIYKTVRSGSIDYKKIPEVEYLVSKLDADYLEKFRTNSSESWTVKIDKDEKCKK